MRPENAGQSPAPSPVASNDAGFSYVDVMIAVTILLVGIMAMLSAITGGIVMTTTSSQHLAAKQYAQSTVESVFSARDLDQLSWDAIGNTGDSSIPGGVFLAGVQPIYQSAGKDGIVGTADDQAGPDGILGNADDAPAVSGFTRQITIVNIPDPNRPSSPVSLRQITVTISYQVGVSRQTEILTTYAANYRTQGQ
jgi:hypothetical protein